MSLEKNLAEMAQGILVSQRHARYAQLERWEKARKIVVRLRVTGPGNWRRTVWLYSPFPDLLSDMGMTPIGTLLAECEDNKDYPTEAFVAQVALGIQALSNFVGVYEPVQWAPA